MKPDVLKNWAREYLKNKDAFAKAIIEIQEKDQGLVAKYKTKEETVLVKPVLDNSLELSTDSFISIVTLNKKENLNFLLTNWHSLAKYPRLTLYFVNPDSGTETKWIIRPQLHDKVADDDSLKTGLLSLFATVEEVR